MRPKSADQQPAERLQKVLARLGLASRREAEEWIRAGRVTVNDKVATLGMRVRPTDRLRLDGRLIRQQAPRASQRVFVCHRSPGEYLRSPSAEADEGEVSDVPALLERLPRRAGRRFIPISPMPRADGGLELVTSDGELADRLQRTVRRLESEFSVRVRGELSEPQLQGILEGLLDRGVRLKVLYCRPAGGEGVNHWYAMGAVGASGKDVRQLFERQGARVSRILRVRLGPLQLDRRLTRGHFRELTPQELQALVGPPADSRSSRPSRHGSPGRAGRDRGR